MTACYCGAIAVYECSICDELFCEECGAKHKIFYDNQPAPDRRVTELRPIGDAKTTF